MSEPVIQLVGKKKNKKKKGGGMKPTTDPFWSQIQNLSSSSPIRAGLIQIPPVVGIAQATAQLIQNQPTAKPVQSQLGQSQAKPGLMQTPFKPGLIQTPIRPGLIRPSGKPGLLPLPGLLQSPKPGLLQTPRPGQHQPRPTHILLGQMQPTFRPVFNKKMVELVDDNSPKNPGTVTATKSISLNTVSKNETNTTASNATNTTAKNATSTTTAADPPITINQPTPDQIVQNFNIYSKQQQKKWIKFQAKIQKKLEEKRQAQGNKSDDATENKPEEDSQTSINKDSNQTTPSNEKPKIAISVSSSSTNATTVAPPVTNTVPPKSSPAQGFSIPTLEPAKNSAKVITNPRSSAGSFFKAMPAITQQSKPQERGILPIDVYAYKYPKGIPRSFLTHQQLEMMSQQPGILGPAPIMMCQQPRMLSQQPGILGQAPGIMIQDTIIQQTVTADSPIWPVPSPTNTSYQPTMVPTHDNTGTVPMFVQTENQSDVQQPYSPSDVYSEHGNSQENESSESSELNQGGQKRLSAFQRLGPVSQPKKPKLTINLTLNKEQPVREVVNATDDDPDRYTPVHLRKNIIMSTDETVMKYLSSWPWRKNVGVRRSATARNSRSVMILEQEQMEEVYDRDSCFIQITVKGYPSTWTKERVLDAILDNVKGYSLIPCFTEFYEHECKFLTLRSRSALIILHKTGFYIHRDGVELVITISQTDLTLNQIDFIPRIILRKRIAMAYENKKLNLSAFTLQDDISHFIYFPLSRIHNQSEFIQLQSVIDWDHLTVLDLSHNRLTDISGFDLCTVTPRLKHLNLSHNYLNKITVLIKYRELPLNSIHLEGNPLCNDYIDPDHYIKVIRMMFPAVSEIDGVPIHRGGELPQCKQNYCPDDAKEVAEKYLEVFFPLLDSGPEHRSMIQGLYEDDATLTITYCYKLRYGQIYRSFRNLFLYARFLDEGETDSVVGAMAITKLINRWPHTEHDPFTFTVDVLSHSESTTILRVSGILKLTAETLAEDEHLLSFTRTIVLYSEDGAEYKIHNEMVYWDEPTPACARSAFRVNTISQKKLNLKIESTTDEDLREKLLMVFMKLTTMDEKISKRCLELNSWNFKQALEHFTKLLKSNNLDSITKEVAEHTNTD